MPCSTPICATPLCWCRSLTWVSWPPGPVCSNYVCGTLFYPSRTSCANAFHSSFDTQNFWVITAWFAAVTFRPVPPTVGVVTHSEEFCESWNLSCISVCSSFPISVYMCNISTWSTTYFMSHHFKWQTWPGRGRSSIAFGEVGALGSAFSFLSCSGRSASLNLSSWSGSEYSAGFLTSIARNVSGSHRKIGETTQVSSGHSSFHCLETSLGFLVSPSTNMKHASHHLSTLHDVEAPHDVYLCTRAFSVACSSAVNSRSKSCACSFGIRMSCFPIGSFDSAHLHIVNGFAICVILYTACCSACSLSVQIACNKLFTAEYIASVACFSITVSSSWLSGAPENSHIVGQHQP